MTYYSPLRYPGGKGKIAEFIKKILEVNSLTDGVYVEPYAGGASVALSLVFEEYVNKIIINDFDRSIYAFWHSVLFETNKLCNLISSCKIDLETWREQKSVQKTKEKANLLKLGFSTFFLNRTNRSGIIKAGVIGGNEQKGNFKLDARFNKEELISRIKKIALYKDRISLFNYDAVYLIKEISKTLPLKSLIYFDPPYYLKGKELYVNHYTHEDHVLVSRMINSLEQHRWIVSYDSTAAIRKLYVNNKKFEYQLNYSAAKSKFGKEVLIYHNDVYIPQKIRPSTI